MYRIVNDKRTIMTKEKLYNTLISYKDKSEFINLSVCDLCNKANVSRSSFYRSFDEIVDVLDYKLYILLEENYNNYIQKNKRYNQTEYALGLITIYIENFKLIKMLAHLSRFDIIYNNVRKITSSLYERYKLHIDKTVFEYTMNLAVSIAICGIYTWNNEMYEKKPEEILVIIRKTLNTFSTKLK